MPPTQVAQSTRTTVFRVPVNTPALHGGVPNSTIAGQKSVSSEEQIESCQTFLNEVTIRLAQILERWES